MTSRPNYIQLASTIAKSCLPSRKKSMRRKAFLLMASFTFGIIDTITVNTSRNLCLWMIWLSRSISRCRPLFRPSWKSIKIFSVFNLRQLKMLLHGMKVCLYSILHHYFKPYRMKLLSCEDVQAFSVWEKDAKDASGFVGYCYLDLFPRGMRFSFIKSCSFDSGLDRGEIFACCCLASFGRLWSSQQYTPLSVVCDGCEFGETHSG